MPVPSAFGRKKHEGENGTLQCSACPERHGYHVIKDDMVSGWAPAVGHTVKCPLGASQKGTKNKKKSGQREPRRKLEMCYVRNRQRCVCQRTAGDGRRERIPRLRLSSISQPSQHPLWDRKSSPRSDQCAHLSSRAQWQPASLA